MPTRGGRPGPGGEAVPAGQDGRPGPRGGQRGGPQHRLLQVPPERDELQLPARRHGVVGQPGRGLDADPPAVPRQVQAPPQRRLAVAGPQPPAAAAPGRVDEHRLGAGQGDVPDVGGDGGHPAGHAVDARRSPAPSARAADRRLRPARGGRRPGPPGPRRCHSTGRPSRPAPAYRAERYRAITSDEACSSPARVKNMSIALLNFARASSRSSCWARASTTRSTGYLVRRLVPRRSAPPPSAACRASSARSSCPCGASRAAKRASASRGSVRRAPGQMWTMGQVSVRVIPGTD